MKQIELNLKKRLLIVEDAENGTYFPPRYIDYHIEKDDDVWKLLCKGSELTEEIAKELVESPDNFQFLDAENTFIGELEKHGYYWGENPLGEDPKKNKLLGTRIMNMIEYGKWQEAESKTFNLNKTLIFEILL